MIQYGVLHFHFRTVDLNLLHQIATAKGGGLAIVCKDGLEVDVIQEGELLFSLCHLEDQVWEPMCLCYFHLQASVYTFQPNH